VLEHPMDGVTVLRGWGVCARVAGVGSEKEGGAAVIGDVVGSGGILSNSNEFKNNLS
jgi:hypothetical protein